MLCITEQPASVVGSHDALFAKAKQVFGLRVQIRQLLGQPLLPIQKAWQAALLRAQTQRPNEDDGALLSALVSRMGWSDADLERGHLLKPATLDATIVAPVDAAATNMGKAKALTGVEYLRKKQRQPRAPASDRA